MKNIKINLRAYLLIVLVASLPIFANAHSSKIVLSAYDITVQWSKDDLTGGWAYTVEGAPTGYEKGLLLILEEDGNYKVQVQAGSSTMIGRNVRVNKNTITFDLNVEDQKVTFALTAAGSTISGTRTTSDGVLKINGAKSLSAG